MCPPEKFDLVIRGGTCVLPGEVTQTDLGIVGDRILQIGPELAEGAARVLEARGRLVIPGFVNAHSHSYGELARHEGAGLPLEPWMNHALAATVNRSPEEIYVSSAIHAIEALRTGTTTIVDHIGGRVDTLSSAAHAYKDIGIRSRIAPMIADLRLPETVGIDDAAWPLDAGAGDPAFDVMSAPDLLAATLELRDAVADGIDCDVILGPSAPQRVSEAMFEAIAELHSATQMPVHIHLLETRLQAALSAPGGQGWVRFLDRLNILNASLSVAHGIWLDRDEIELLAERSVTIVHNPQSNLQIGSGVGDLTCWRRAGVNIALGTDSVNCGGSMDMISSMRLAALLHRPGNLDNDTWETPRSVLALATAGGARALGIPSGEIKVGALADLALFEMAGTVWASDEDPISTLVLSAYDHRAESVVVGGRVVVENHHLHGVNEEDLLAAVAPSRHRLHERNSHLRDLAVRQRRPLTAAAAGAPLPRPLLPLHPSQDGPSRRTPSGRST
ncbi:amidohydrolase family protein [Mycolicibacterium mengxianglii]|uniref:amidohydrolase family protein n=1 Tax=Mycolicibacterium mengxianglii TaxID=2736649 RepID=UPI0018D06624|nr:amidohydrolase family protein [Mycolicibacterium mengxianglii]